MQILQSKATSGKDRNTGKGAFFHFVYHKIEETHKRGIFQCSPNACCPCFSMNLAGDRQQDLSNSA
jgi:hypothetical protein